MGAAAAVAVVAAGASWACMNIELYSQEVPPRRVELDSGAVLLGLPMRTAHAVTLGVWLRTGSQDEPAGLGGISHFLEHIVFKGSRFRSAFEIAETFDRLGAAVDAFTTKDSVGFTIKVLPEYFEQVIELLAEMILYPRFDGDLVGLEQDVVCEEIQEAFDTPEDRLHDAFAARVYGQHPRSYPILGSLGSVRSLDSTLLRAEHQRLFTGPNTVIAMAGNIPETFWDIVATKFADLETRTLLRPEAEASGAGGPAAAIVDMPLEGVDPFRLTLLSPIIQTYFEVGNLGIPYHHKDRIPLFLLSNLLGGGMSSRIFQAVREREGLAYSVYTYSDMGRDIGLVSCAGSCSPDNMGRIEEVIRSEYLGIAHNGVPEQELETNRAQLKSQLIFSLEGMVNQMFRAARNEIFDGGFLPVADLVKQIDGVDVDTVVRCAGSYYNAESLLVATHGPEAVDS